jgi:hypothetical protein
MKKKLSKYLTNIFFNNFIEKKKIIFTNVIYFINSIDFIFLFLFYVFFFEKKKIRLFFFVISLRVFIVSKKKNGWVRKKILTRIMVSAEKKMHVVVTSKINKYTVTVKF